MLGRHLLRASPKQLRPFTTSSGLARAPSLSDITPKGAASFETKQRAFREKLAAQVVAKQQEIRSSRSILHSMAYGDDGF